MKTQRRLRQPLLLVLALILLTLTLLPAAAPVRAQLAGDPRFGLAEAGDDSAAAVELGAGFEIVILRWDRLQPSAGQFRPDAAADAAIAAARSAGREVLVVLVGTPAWATDGDPGEGVPRGLDLAYNDQGNVWAAFVKQAVTYYTPRGVSRYGVWRDVDIQQGFSGHTWDGSANDYVLLLKSAYLAARSANPSALIHTAGYGKRDSAWFGRFITALINEPTAASNNYYFDVASVHVLASSDAVFTQVGNPYAVMSNARIPLKEVWVNEMNARPASDPAYPPGTSFREYSAVTLDQQAAFMVQGYALAFAAGASRVAAYRLVDDLEEDGGEAFGLIRADGSLRPAYNAYALVTREFRQFELARRVDEESFPLVDYVRLTSSSRVVHIAWARSTQTATLIIPARSAQATLFDLNGNRWIFRPQNAEYRIALSPALCNDPQTVGGCLIGGAPWILVEEGVAEALTSRPAASRVEPGGATPTPDPSFSQTATAAARPTSTPTLPPTALPSPTLLILPTNSPIPPSATAGLIASPTAGETPGEAPPAPSEAAAPVEALESPAAPSSEAPTPEPEPPTATPDPGPIVLNPDDVAPRGLQAAAPFLLMALGGLVILAGFVFFLRPIPGGNHSTEPSAENPDDHQTQFSEQMEVEGEGAYWPDDGGDSAGDGEQPLDEYNSWAEIPDEDEV